MNHITYRISLDLRKTDSGVVVKVKRDDTVKKLAISLTDGGKPYHITEDCSAVFAGEKPDGTILCNPCSIEDCVVTYEITPQTIAQFGEVKSEIRLYSTDGDLVTSPSFTILVVPPVYDDDRVIESHDEVNALTELITSATSTIQKGEKIVQEANELFDSMPTTYVSFDPQNPTAEEAAQARENIGAASQVEAEFFHRRLAEGSISLLDKKSGDSNTLYVEKGVLTLASDAQTVAILTGKDEQRILEEANDGKVLYTQQELTEDQKTSARQNIGAASASDVESVRNKTAESVLFTSQVLTEKQKAEARNNIDAAAGSEVVKTYQQDLTHQQMDTARYNINAASVDQVVRVDTAQNLSEERKAQARENIGAVGTAEHTDLLGIVQDLERRTDETVQRIEDAVTNTTIKKNAEASVSSIKILHSPETSDAIFAEGTTVSDKDDLLVNALTLRGDFEGGIDNDSVILRNVHAGENSTDAVNLAQVKEMVGGNKVYEHIATITVAPDADGSLPQHVIFSADSNGNAFELSDFIIHATAAFVDGNKSTLYMNVNKATIINNGAISSLGNIPRTFQIFFRSENDGCKRAEFTGSMMNNAYFNPQWTIESSRLVSPIAGYNLDTITEIKLFTLLPSDGSKEWVEGSTFELWGVRV